MLILGHLAQIMVSAASVLTSQPGSFGRIVTTEVKV